MNCEVAHERIVLAAYGELPDDASHELDRHLAICSGCAEDREQLRALKLLAGAYAVEEPSPNLMARSRMRLEEALDTLPPKRWFERLSQKLSNNFASLRMAPVAASLLVLLAAGGGGWGGFHLAQKRAVHAAAVTQLPGRDSGSATAQGEVSNISSIVRQPNSDQVEVHYNEVVHHQVRGSLDDPSIRHLLMLASEDSASLGVRDDSVGLMAAECRAGHSCRADGIRDALMVALRFDRNAGVRQKALEGLEPYVAEDMRVRNAVLQALLNDNDPRIRTTAINVLVPVEADTSVRQALSNVAVSDRNPQIRLVSRQVLSRVPEIQ